LLFLWGKEEGMKAEIKSAVTEIRRDRDKGARQLAMVALEALKSTAPDMSGEELREACRHLALARPMMAAIDNAVAAAWAKYLESGDGVSAASDVIEEIETAPEAMVLQGVKVIPSDTVMTFSWSSTVIDLLSRVKPRRVITSEARPTGEGLRVARELVHRAGVTMTYITEAQMALFVNEADAVVVGADTILPDGGFINKIGTRLLALAARDADVPVYVAADTLKVAAPSEPLPFAPEEGKTKEICSEKWLEVRNVYYEMTPAYLVTNYITEQGLMDPAEMGKYSAEAEKRWQALMNSHEL
jgi:translation initiation factor 2B subunit (eIF-2B alpha/beta/delta family)